MRVGQVTFSPGFLFLAALLYYFDDQNLVPLCLLACLVHELGHWWVIHFVGGQVGKIKVTIVGAEMTLVGSLSYGKEFLVALAGPGLNLILALFFCRFHWGLVFAGVNFALGVFNLLPVGGLDGGRILSSLLALALGPQWGTLAQSWIDLIFGAALLLFGGLAILAYGNFTLLLVALWLNFGGRKKGKRGNRLARVI